MQIKKEYKFYAGHRNQELSDKCFRPHGHEYKIFCIFNTIRKGSISTLFNDFDSKIEPMLKDEFDHRFLIDKNDRLLQYLQGYERESGENLGLKILPFASSVENVCYYLFNEIIIRFQFDLERIELQETRSSTLIYTRANYEEDKKALGWPISEAKIETGEDYKSLYDYLGYAAGSSTGYAVACEAYTKGVRVCVRVVTTGTYKGEVNIYPEYFLREYFKR